MSDAVPVLAALEPLEQRAIARGRSLVRYMERAGWDFLEGHILLEATDESPAGEVYLHRKAPGPVVAHIWPEGAGRRHATRWPADWLLGLDLGGGSGLLPSPDFDDEPAPAGAVEPGAPGTSRSPGAEHHPTGSGGDKCLDEP
jgi:hypothetical protein